MMLKASQARWGGWGPHLTEPWLSPRMEIPPPLWSITQFSTILMVKTSSLAGFPKLHCPLPHVLVLCTSRESLHPLCALWLQSCSKAWSLIIPMLNKLGPLRLSQLGYIGCFCKRWSRGLWAFQLLPCFLRWKETFTGKAPICEDCWHFPFLFHIQI